VAFRRITHSIAWPTFSASRAYRNSFECVEKDVRVKRCRTCDYQRRLVAQTGFPRWWIRRGNAAVWSRRSGE
jgi:hypothetical protein